MQRRPVSARLASVRISSAPSLTAIRHLIVVPPGVIMARGMAARTLHALQNGFVRFLGWTSTRGDHAGPAPRRLHPALSPAANGG